MCHILNELLPIAIGIADESGKTVINSEVSLGVKVASAVGTRFFLIEADVLFDTLFTKSMRTA